MQCGGSIWTQAAGGNEAVLLIGRRQSSIICRLCRTPSAPAAPRSLQGNGSSVALSRHGCYSEPRTTFSPSVDLELHRVLSSQPSLATIAAILRQCGAFKALGDGKLVHQHINTRGFHRNIFICNCLVLMYAECESMEDAQETFDKISSPNWYSWSILIKGYALNDKLDEAMRVFAGIANPDVVVWNTVIAACAQKGQSKAALDLFWKMQQDGIEPNIVTFVCTLEACSNLTSLVEAQDFLKLLNRSKFGEDKLVKTALLTLLGKFGKLDQAWSIFDKSSHRDVVTWNAMIAALAQNGLGEKALCLYFQMQQHGIANSPVTYVCAFDACTSLQALKEGFLIHKWAVLHAYDGYLAVGNALVHMYGKCGCLSEARNSFCRLSFNNVVSWTALMTACVDGNENEEALQIYHRMQQHGFKPNEVTFICALDACASLAALEEGFSIHADIVCNAHETNVLVGTALVHMYGKCGLVNHAQCGFKKIGRKDAASWNAVLTAYAQSGHAEETLESFSGMQAAGFMPNSISLTCVLTVCSHMGWVDIGKGYFMSLCTDVSMPPAAEHWSCMIDLLGRAGNLEEAEILLDSMHGRLVTAGWTSFLASCRTHVDTERGLRAADYCCEMDPMNPVPFVVLANICASGDEWALLSKEQHNRSTF